MPLFCKDCRHMVPADSGKPENARCDATRRESVNLVTGAKLVERAFCEVTRMKGQPCDVDARLFEAHEQEAAA